MKKRLSACFGAVLVGALLLGAAACSGEPLPLERMEWEFVTLQDEEGRVICCSEGMRAGYPDAATETIACSFGGETLTIQSGSGRSWRAVYSPAKGGAERTAIYRLTGESAEGMMTSGVTEFYGGGAEGTLIITVGGRTLTFRAEIPD